MPQHRDRIVRQAEDAIMLEFTTFYTPHKTTKDHDDNDVPDDQE